MGYRICPCLLVVSILAFCQARLYALPLPPIPERLTLETDVHNELITAHFRQFCKGTFNRHRQSSSLNQFTPVIGGEMSRSPFEERCVISQVQGYLAKVQERLLRLEESRVVLSQAAKGGSTAMASRREAPESNRTVRDALASIASESGHLRKSLQQVFSGLDDRASETYLSPAGPGGRPGQLERLGRQIETTSQELCGYLNGEIVVHVRDLQRRNIISMLKGLEQSAKALRKDR